MDLHRIRGVWIACFFLLIGYLAFAESTIVEGKVGRNSEEKNALDRYGDPLPTGVMARLGTVRLRHADGVFSVAFSADGKAVASGSGDGIINFWEVETGKRLMQFRGHTRNVTSLSLRAEDKILASTSTDSTLRLWNVLTGRQLKLFNLSQKGLTLQYVAVSPDAKAIAFRADQGNISLQKTSDGTILRSLPAQDSLLDSLIFSPNGRLLVAANGKNARIWDVSTGKEVGNIPGAGNVVAFSPDGVVFVAASGKTIQGWETASGKKVFQFEGHEYPVIAVDVGPSGKTVVTMCSNRGSNSSISVWDVANAKELHKFGIPLFPSIAFSPDGKKIALGKYNGFQAIELLDLSKGKECLQLEGHSCQVKSLAFSPNGKILATAGKDLVLLWDIATQKVVYKIHGTQSVAFSPNGKLLATSKAPNSACLWDASSGVVIRKFKGKMQPVCSLAFSPDGKILATGHAGPDSAISMDRGFIRFWEVSTGKEISKIEADRNSIGSVTFSPNGRILASTSDSPMISFWDVFTGKKISTLFDPDNPWSVTFSSDGRLLASSDYGEGGSIKLWDLETGKIIFQITGRFCKPVFAFNSRALISSSNDGSIRFWEVVTGKEFLRLPSCEASLWSSTVLSPNERFLAIGMADTTILLWDTCAIWRGNFTNDKELGPSEIEIFWADLARKDAVSGYKAIGALAGTGKKLIPFLKNRLQPLTDEELQARILRLIGDLDSNEFVIREEASKELRKLGAVVKGSLQKTLDGQPSAEARQRVEILLKQIASPEGYNLPTGESLRRIRAIQILERIGTKEAQEVLEILSRGTLLVRETHEAKVALDRLRNQRFEK